MADAVGTVTPRFEPVADAFADVVASQAGTGAALAVWQDGSWVVDLWGGHADALHTRPWRADTIVMVYSTGKPFAAMAALLLADRGELDLDAPLTRYWPEMRARTTMRQVLAHRSGHVVVDQPLDEDAWYDWERLCGLLAEQTPAWEPGTQHGEAATFYGHLIGEVVRRIDGRTIGRFLRDEVCGPLGLDVFVGLTDPELERVADVTGFGPSFRAEIAHSPGLLPLAMANPPGCLDPKVVNGDRWRRAEIPAVNGHGTARGVAGLYVALEDGAILSPTTRGEATSAAGTGKDLVLGDAITWGLGFQIEPGAYGMGGLGGSLGWWSSEGAYALGFVTGEIADFDRVTRLDNAVRDCIGLPPLVD
jgi:CubicO group peptidase (beta-lactamase class C family)